MNNNNIYLAPMDGYTDQAFRRIVLDINPNVMVYSELTSADGIRYNSKKTIKRVIPHITEKNNFVPQIFGKNIENIEYASKFLYEQYGCQEININMGCPAKKVIASGHGAALINNFLSWKFFHEKKNTDEYIDVISKLSEHEHISDNLPLAGKIVYAAKKSNAIISVKTRLGWKDKNDIFEFAKVLIDNGCTKIIVHGRTYKQGYSGDADWENIYKLKSMYKDIIIIGNGDIGIKKNIDNKNENILDDKRFNKGYFTNNDLTNVSTLIKNKINNLDGIMIGRASFGNPWIFTDNYPKSFLEKIPIIKKHYEYCVEDKGIEIASKEMRKHLVAYVKGLVNATDMRSKLVHTNNWLDVEKIFNEFGFM